MEEEQPGPCPSAAGSWIGLPASLLLEPLHTVGGVVRGAVGALGGAAIVMTFW